ncbi:MAG: fibronectin type III domain-containing protein [Bacteroidetes bacterium]|nr:fibronectin type III domain-containing protein [Bacteroidota bacterium]
MKKLIYIICILSFTFNLNAQTSDLDTGFGVVGIVELPLDAYISYCWDIVLYDDGKIAASGFIDDEIFSRSKAIVVRLLTNGDLDSTFSEDGMVEFGLADKDFYANAISIHPDGGLLIAGQIKSTNGIDNNYFVLKLLDDGSIDTMFADAGFYIDPVEGANSEFEDLVITADEKILLAGTTYISGIGWTMITLQLEANGNVDSTYGVDGLTNYNIPLQSTTTATIELTTDGSFFLTGYVFFSNLDFFAVKYFADGIQDLSFGSGGKIKVDFYSPENSVDYPYDAVVDSDGRLFITGLSKPIPSGENSRGATVCILDEGIIDSSYGNDGVLLLDTCVSTLITGNAIQPDGKLIVGGHGYCGDSTQIILARYTIDGLIDTTFFSGGVHLEPVRGLVQTLELQNDGKIMVGGKLNGQFMIIRFKTPDVSPCSEAPANLSVPMINANKAKLQWEPVIGAVKYKLQYKEIGTETWNQFILNTNSKIVTGLLPSTNYKFRVRALCEDTTSSPWSEVFSFNTPAFRYAYNNNMEDQNILIYPNPFSDYLQIQLPEILDEKIHIEIVSLTGVVLDSRYFILNNTNYISLDATDIPAGLYTVILATNAGKIRSQVVKLYSE